MRFAILIQLFKELFKRFRSLKLLLGLTVTACCCDILFFRLLKPRMGFLSIWECKGKKLFAFCKLFRDYFFSFFLASFQKSTGVLTPAAALLVPRLSIFSKRLLRLSLLLVGLPKFGILFLRAKPFLLVLFSSLTCFSTLSF